MSKKNNNIGEVATNDSLEQATKQDRKTFTVNVQTGTNEKGDYKFLEIALSPDYKKRVFVKGAEIALLTALGKTESTAVLSEDIGKSSGKPYTYLAIKITEERSMRVFLEGSELDLIKLTA